MQKLKKLQTDSTVLSHVQTSSYHAKEILRFVIDKPRNTNVSLPTPFAMKFHMEIRA